MIRFRSLSIALAVAALSVCAHAQGTTGGLLYASDFANWSLPQGNTPMQGTIFYPNPNICQVTSNGYTFLAAKVGRPLTIVDGINTETFTPTAVVVNNNTCMISGTMARSHSSYSLKSGTAGAQEAVDYQASQPQGANIVLTPTWTQVGGTTGIVTGTLKGNAGVTILDQRTAVITPYVWNGSAYIAQPFAGGATVTNQASGVVPLATTPTAIGAQSHLDDGVTTPATITASEPIAAPSLSAPLLRVTACTTGQVPLGDGTGLCITPAPKVAISLTSPATAAVGTNVVTVVKLTSPAASSVSLPASSNFPGCPSASCPIYQVKDGAGNSSTYPITVSAADGKTIDGASSFIIQSNYQSITLVFNGTQWNLL